MKQQRRVPARVVKIVEPNEAGDSPNEPTLIHPGTMMNQAFPPGAQAALTRLGERMAVIEAERGQFLAGFLAGVGIDVATTRVEVDVQQTPGGPRWIYTVLPQESNGTS